MPQQPTESELAELAIAVYIEELATDRRVLYVGDPQSKGPERLAKLARSVDLVSPRARARGTRRGGRVQSRRWPTEDDAGRWDVVVVPDVSSAGFVDDERIDQIGGWLAKGGVLVAGAEDPNGDRGLSYEAFYDLLQDSFDSVRMVGQAPFHGFALVDFAPPGDLEVTFDGSLLEGAGERARRYLALCGSTDVVLDPYAVVQIPSASQQPTISAPPREPPTATRELESRVREQQDALDAANVHAEGLERELEDARAALTKADAAIAEQDTIKHQTLAKPEPRDTSAEDAARAELLGRISTLQAELELASRAAPSEVSYDEEYARLESALHDNGRQLTAARVELERRATLVRDLVEQMAEDTRTQAAPHDRAPLPATPVSPTTATVDMTLDWPSEELQGALQQQVSEAVARAVGAEAERAELAFRLDEARGAQVIAEQSREQDLEEMRRMEAALRGTVRGLNARLAEVTELFQQTQARLVLTEDDRHTAKARVRELERDLAESRERVELEFARVRTKAEVDSLANTVPPAQTPAGAAQTAQEATLAAREGQLVGALMRCQEQATALALEKRQANMQAELAKEGLLELEERVVGMRYGYETRLAELVAEMDQTGGDAERALVMAGEARARLDELERTEATLRGQLMGTQLRLADREEAVRALLTHSGEGDAPPVDPPASSHVVFVGRSSDVPPAPIHGAAELQEELVRLRSEAEGLRAQLEADTAKEGDRPDPRAMLGARDAMISRLQTELAHATENTRRLQGEVEKKTAALSAKRAKDEDDEVVAKVVEDEDVRELTELTDRLEQSEGERKRANEALEAAREILSHLLDELPEAGADVDLGVGDSGLRQRLSQLDAEAADREVLLRSMTAQLQERDDRIRALERFDDANDENDPDALRASLLELEERVGRLRDELENERRARRRLEEG